MKILITIKKLVMGGVETSLLNLIKALVSITDVEIDLLIINKQGELIKEIPESIKTFYLYPHEKIIDNNRGKFTQCFFSLLRSFGINHIVSTLRLNKFKKSFEHFHIRDDYDLAISFNGFDYLSNELVLNHVFAKKKICIIHNDVSKLKLPYVLTKQFLDFNYCMGCSKSCASQFKKKYKKVSKVDVLYNFQDIERIFNGANENAEKIKSERLCICTIGRMQKQKMPMRLMKILNKLKLDGFKFDFYWIGDGPDSYKVKKFIARKGLDNIFLLGNQINPFKYLKQADLFVLASLYEAAPMVYAESMTLRVPILTTDTCSAQELVGQKGWVCKNNKKSIYNSLKYILRNPKTILEKKQQLKDYKWDNKNIIDTIINGIAND